MLERFAHCRRQRPAAFLFASVDDIRATWHELDHSALLVGIELEQQAARARIVGPVVERLARVEVVAVADAHLVAGAELRSVLTAIERVRSPFAADVDGIVDAVAFEHAQVDRLRTQLATLMPFAVLFAREVAQQALLEREVQVRRLRKEKRDAVDLATASRT